MLFNDFFLNPHKMFLFYLDDFEAGSWFEYGLLAGLLLSIIYFKVDFNFQSNELKNSKYGQNTAKK